MATMERKYFAAGDYLTWGSSDSEFDLRIDSPFQKPGWSSRTASSSGIFPGTAIEFEENYYEVIGIQYRPGPPARIVYSLKKWEDRFPIRTQFHYTIEEAVKLAASHRDRIHSNRLTVLLNLFSPLVGMIPGEMQTALANRYGCSPILWTFLSSLMIMIPSGSAIIFMAAAIFKNPLPGPPALHFLYPFGFYFFVESLLRMFHSTRQDEPIGSLPVAIPLLLIRGIWNQFDPAIQEKQMRQMQVSSKKGREIFLKPDTIHAGSGDSYDIEVISILPKDHWNVYSGIQYQDELYGLVESQKTGTGKDARYKYYLKKAGEGIYFRSIHPYTPDEVREIYMQRRRRELGTWVDTFSPIWGLLDGADQKRLRELYDFPALKYTKWTVWILAISGAINLIVSCMNLMAGTDTPVDILLLLVSGYFIIESRSRWNLARKGEPSGSLLSILVRPLASRLLA